MLYHDRTHDEHVRCHCTPTVANVNPYKWQLLREDVTGNRLPDFRWSFSLSPGWVSTAHSIALVPKAGRLYTLKQLLLLEM